MPACRQTGYNVLMDKKIALFFVGILFVMNIFAWQEVFALTEVKKLQVNFLDVGQGDSAFIKTPGGHQIVIDGGPDAKVLEKLSNKMPFWDKTLDLVILSHPEKDHMQGLIYALQTYKADYILWNGIKKTSPEYQAWINVLEKQKKMGAKIITSKPGQEIKAGKVLVDILSPLEDLQDKEIKNTSNDTGVVAKIIYGKNSFLFTADIDMAGERKIIKSGENVLANVLKIAHHGSKYSTSDQILQAVKPSIAIIEVGAKNTYGHPTPEVLQKLANFGVQTLRTDQKGDITIISNGQNIQIK